MSEPRSAAPCAPPGPKLAPRGLRHSKQAFPYSAESARVVSVASPGGPVGVIRWFTVKNAIQ